MHLARIRASLQHPVVAGVAVAATGTAAFLLARALFGLGGGDNWPAPGDRCPVAVYTGRLGDALGQRAHYYMPWVRHAADSFSVDPTLLAALVQTESKFQPKAGSSAGAVGLSQHIASTALGTYKKLVAKNTWPFAPLSTSGDGKESYYAGKGVPMTIDRTDPKQSLWLGAATLRALLDAGKGTTWALAAYNAGAGTANEPQSQWPAETRAYVNGVPERQNGYQQIAEICGQGSLT